MSKLFEVAILYHEKPTKAEEEQGKRQKTNVLKGITTVVAKDEREALLTAARDIPADYLDKLDNVEVLIRPF